MSKKQSKITRSGQGLAGPKRLVTVPPYAVRACIVPRDIAIETYPKWCIIIDHLPFIEGDRRLQEEKKDEDSEVKIGEIRRQDLETFGRPQNQTKEEE